MPIGWSFQQQTPVSPRSVTSPHSGGEIVAPCTTIHHLSVPRVTCLVETRISPTVAVPSINQASNTFKCASTNIPSFLPLKFPIFRLRLPLQIAIRVSDHLCLQQNWFLSTFFHIYQNIYLCLFVSIFILVFVSFFCSSFPFPLSTLVCLSRLCYPMCSCHMVCSLARVLRMLQRTTK